VRASSLVDAVAAVPDASRTAPAGACGVESLMGYYGILDRVPKGRDEDDGFQLWIRRHDEYDNKRRVRNEVAGR
jgi:predicted dithiol-disulfide oxidoreductase (DUF899 family)